MKSRFTAWTLNALDIVYDAVVLYFRVVRLAVGLLWGRKNKDITWVLEQVEMGFPVAAWKMTQS